MVRSSPAVSYSGRSPAPPALVGSIHGLNGPLFDKDHPLDMPEIGISRGYGRPPARAYLT
jgi:hypothetical protein